MVTKVSEITANDVVKYIREDANEVDIQEIETFLNVAKSFASNYTGLPITSKDDSDSLDTYADIVYAIYVLCQDMHDNRTLYVDNTNLNFVVKTILDSHCRIML